ncbi:MAG TPA: enoyl-CoA hydratase-related protein, partial [Longimicrobiales bacterium]|nr:enoyl-CoA hydratase-related protein [Longimicrobiales bacterium]
LRGGAGGAATAEDALLVEREGAVGWIRINRPERLNAFADGMRDDLEAALARLEADASIHCVVITGVGRAFSTGGDVRTMARLLEEEDTEGFEALVRAGAAIVQRIASMRTPVIAAVNGIAAGAGACLALACDLRVASESASIGFAFMRVGLLPDWGGTFFLPRIVGPSVAAELFYTGEMISAARAERMGIFNRVVPADDLTAAARALAGQIAARPALAVSRTKEALRRSPDASLEEMLELETRSQVEAFRSPDAREGVAAFLEKRAPRFGG